jgi:hypothetical protein
VQCSARLFGCHNKRMCVDVGSRGEQCGSALARRVKDESTGVSAAHEMLLALIDVIEDRGMPDAKTHSAASSEE